jgi:hypothetical protein
LGAIAAAALLLGPFVASSTSGSSTKIHSDRRMTITPLTGFGGYHLTTKVTQISARWRVPAISKTSRVGIAATWIGAQNSIDSHFIQLGILEICNQKGRGSYQAFWSDTALDFTPQPLGVIGAGDHLSVSLVRNSRGWSLTFHDRTNALSVDKQIDYGVGAPFTMGEWLQEDPSPSDVASRDVAYPDVANVTFQRLRVNDEVPRLKRADGQTLSASGGLLRVPTLVRHDSFTFVRPLGAADQYLIDAAALDKEAATFNAQIVFWKSTSRKSKSRDTKAMVAAFEFGASEISAQAWPKSTHGDVGELVQDMRADAVNLNNWSTAGFKTEGSAFQAIRDATEEQNVVIDKLRSALGLPPP